MRKIIVLLSLLLFSMALHAADKSPSEIFMEYHSALKRSFSTRTVMPFHSQAFITRFEEKFPADMRDRAFYIMKTGAPKKVEIQESEIQGDRALLKVVSVDEHPQMRGNVRLILEDGVWKVDEVEWIRDEV